jgi:hypothetical protein
VLEADIGKSIRADFNNYIFYAMPDGKSGASNVKRSHVTMPVGGDMGLFRFPRVGEWVLIGKLGETVYTEARVGAQNVLTGVTPPGGDWVLLSYFIDTPAANAPFYPKDSKSTTDNTKTGYIADQLNPASMTDFINDNGMAMRYKAEKNTNKTQKKEKDGVELETQPTAASNAKWSEIGFYNKKAKWPNTLKTFDETKSGNALDPRRYFRQDVINIQSAGDIESRAENYHLIKAKRFELLSNTDELSPETRADNARDSWQYWSEDKAPLGDTAGDDSALHSGDVHIRAGRSVVIKAQGEIRLQVGRTVVVIDDTGFTVTTGKLRTNAVLSQTTSLSLKARGGISMFGENVDIASSRKFSIADAWGGGLSSVVGMLSMSGIQINQKTYGETQQIFAALMNLITLTQDIAVANASLAAPNKIYASGWVNYGFDVAKMLVTNGKSFYDLWGDYKHMTERKQKLADLREKALSDYLEEKHMVDCINKLETGTDDEKTAAREILAEMEAYNDVDKRDELISADAMAEVMNIGAASADPIQTAVSVLNMILGITAHVYFAVEKVYTRSWQTTLRAGLTDSSVKAPTPSEKVEFRDCLNICAMDVDNGIIQSFLQSIAIVGGIGGPASIGLQSSGDIVIKAGKQKKLYAETSEHVSVPVSIAAEKVQFGIKVAAAVTKLGADVGKLAVQALDKTEVIPSYVEKL